ncbi:hypothetical protein ACL1GO_12855, partial [Corynebacterium striatum]
GSQTTKNDSRNLNAYQINKLNYLQSRPHQKGPIRHTPHQPNTQLSQHNHDHHKVVKVHWHTIEFSDIITTQQTTTT